MDIEGILKNIFNTIDASYYIGRDAVKVPNPDARKGTYAKVFGPNKEILDTGWSEENAWTGFHRANVRWYTDAATTYQAVVEYQWIDHEGVEGSYTKNLEHQADIADEFGTGAGNSYFHENHKYRIIIRSHADVAEDEYVAVDYIRLIVANMHDAQAQYIMAGTVANVPAVQIPRSGYVTVTGDGSTYYYTSTVTLPETPLRYHAVPGIQTSNADFTVVITAKGASSFNVTVRHVDGTNWSGGVNVYWIANCWEEVVSLA